MRFQPLSNFIIYTSISDFTSQRPIYPTAYSTFPLLFFTSVTVYLGYRKSNSSLSFQNLHLIPYSNIKKKTSKLSLYTYFLNTETSEMSGGVRTSISMYKIKKFVFLIVVLYGIWWHMPYGIWYGIWCMVLNINPEKLLQKRRKRDRKREAGYKHEIL